MQIRKIRPARPGRDQVVVEVEGGPPLRLAREVVLAEGLAAGTELDPDRIAELERADELWRAREASLSLLSHRARSAQELRGRLERKEFTVGAAEEAVGRLEAAGLVDDRAFAESFVRDRLRFRPRGRRRLVQELRARGVPADTAESAVEGVLEDTGLSEVDIARDLARAWRPRAGEDRARARRRLHGYLSRRGLSGEAIRAALDGIEL